jgi:hypothetical protein
MASQEEGKHDKGDELTQKGCGPRRTQKRVAKQARAVAVRQAGSEAQKDLEKRSRKRVRNCKVRHAKHRRGTGAAGRNILPRWNTFIAHPVNAAADTLVASGRGKRRIYTAPMV